MARFQLELIYYFTYLSPSSHPTLVCFFPVGLSLLILKAASSENLLNYIIAGQNDPIYKLLPSQWFELQDNTAQTKQQIKFKNQQLVI